MLFSYSCAAKGPLSQSLWVLLRDALPMPLAPRAPTPTPLPTPHHLSTHDSFTKGTARHVTLIYRMCTLWRGVELLHIGV